MTQIVMINSETGAKELRSILLPVPIYDIGMTVEFPCGKDIPGTDQGLVTGYHIYVTQIGGEVITQTTYEVDNTLILDEEEIEGYWPVDDDSPGEAG